MTIAHPENVASGVTVQPGKVLDYLGLNPNDPKAQAVVAVAQRYDLDPLLKHVIVIPRGGVYITRDGLLHVAHRSGQLDGIVVDKEPTLSEDGKEWVARVTVYRKDMRHGFTFPGRYPVNGGNRDYAQEMALKAAEAHALRRAFDVTGLPTLDEQRPESQATRSGLGAVIANTDPSPAPDVAASAPPGQDEAATPRPPVEASAGEALPPTSARARALFAAMGERGIVSREDRLEFCTLTLGRDIGSSKELTHADADRLFAALEAMEPDEALIDVTDAEVVE